MALLLAELQKLIRAIDHTLHSRCANRLKYRYPPRGCWALDVHSGSASSTSGRLGSRELAMLPVQTYTQLLAIVGLVLFQTALAIPLVLSPESSIGNTTTRNRIETCTFQPHWVPNIVRYNDCLAAIDLFRSAESSKSSFQRFEFLARGARRMTMLSPFETPRKYRHRTCTVGVVMMSAFPVPFIPPQAKRKIYQPSDVATLNELQDAAREVAMDCVHNPKVMSRPTVGWKPQGQLLSLGIAVTIWESGSFMDRLIPGGEEIGRNGSGIVDVDVE